MQDENRRRHRSPSEPAQPIPTPHTPGPSPPGRGETVAAVPARIAIEDRGTYERIHMHALRSLAELMTACVASPVEITRDVNEIASGLRGFTHQPMSRAEQKQQAVPPPEEVEV